MLIRDLHVSVHFCNCPHNKPDDCVFLQPLIQEIIICSENLTWQTPPGCRPCCALPNPSVGTAHPQPGTLLHRYLRTFDLIPPMANTNTHKFIKHSPVSNIHNSFITPHSRPGCLPVTLTAYYISSLILCVLWRKERAVRKQDLLAEFMPLLKHLFYAPTLQSILSHYWKQPASSITLSRGEKHVFFIF